MQTKHSKVFTIKAKTPSKMCDWVLTTATVGTYQSEERAKTT